MALYKNLRAEIDKKKAVLENPYFKSSLPNTQPGSQPSEDSVIGKQAVLDKISELEATLNSIDIEDFIKEMRNFILNS